MNFDLCDCPIKIWKSIGTSTPKVRAPLAMCEFIFSHFPTLLGAWNVTPKLHSWPALSQALSLVTNPRLGLQQSTYWNIIHWENPINIITPCMMLDEAWSQSCLPKSNVLLCLVLCSWMRTKYNERKKLNIKFKFVHMPWWGHQDFINWT
jgi:hypothetical protein